MFATFTERAVITTISFKDSPEACLHPSLSHFYLQAIPPLFSISMAFSRHFIQREQYHRWLWWSEWEWLPLACLFNHLSHSSETVWEGLRGVALLEKVYCWGCVWGTKTCTIPSYLYLWLVAVLSRCEFSATLQHTVCLPDAMLPAIRAIGLTLSIREQAPN